jgi:hypothetical protein
LQFLVRVFLFLAELSLYASYGSFGAHFDVPKALFSFLLFTSLVSDASLIENFKTAKKFQELFDRQHRQFFNREDIFYSVIRV